MAWLLEESRPIWMQLCEQIEDRMLVGIYPPGSRFPSVRELAQEAGVNPNTMQRALAVLEEKGLLLSNRTQGRTVTTKEETMEAIKQSHARELTDSYLERMKRLGYTRESAVELLKEGEE